MTLSTPYGGQYQVTLPDGTRVWLNAVSTLRYPSRFDGPERVVELEGEAYFEVRRQEPAASRHAGRGANGSNPAAMVPFVVKTASQVVEVLGTEFNISAYPGEPDTRTTLVGGSVRIKNVESQASNLLMPGQQAVVRGQDTDLNQVDVEVYTAWKDNVFIFGRLELSRVLRQLERWYNVEFSDGQLPQATLSGEIPRNVPLSSVLAMIEGATAMSFEIQRSPASGQERRVVIMK
ncbi:FecR family protein [Parapedobacter sp. 2B3]|uniref:FecR family protein n=1 Tax=Parapedobacter sp. 2B3 TaxID=3342381 RepID=UPI0035B5E205